MSDLSLFQRFGIAVGKGIGYVICEPQLRLGRRRHDNTCDQCNDDCGRYACEKLEFPDQPDGISTLGKMKAMSEAEYRQFCLECSARIEQS